MPCRSGSKHTPQRLNLSAPTSSVPGDCPHLDRLAVADCMHICKSNVAISARSSSSQSPQAWRARKTAEDWFPLSPVPPTHEWQCLRILDAVRFTFLEADVGSSLEPTLTRFEPMEHQRLTEYFRALSEHLEHWGTPIGPRLAHKITTRAVRQPLAQTSPTRVA